MTAHDPQAAIEAWEPPRCEHGKILLGCSHDDCPQQSAYLAEQHAILDALHRRQQDEARVLVRQVLGIEP
jgi:hypothetical protein